MAVEMSIKLSPKQAGKLYQKSMRLEDENQKLREELSNRDAQIDELHARIARLMDGGDDAIY